MKLVILLVFLIACAIQGDFTEKEDNYQQKESGASK